jgi:hypothetical protein
MTKDNLTINGTSMNAMGIFLEDGSIASLMAPPPLKEAAVSRSRLEHGQHSVTTAKYDSREFSLILLLTAESQSDFLTRYGSLCDILATGNLDITTSFTGSNVYHCRYLSCSQFSEFLFGIGKFTIRLIEDNPNDRTAHNE